MALILRAATLVVAILLVVGAAPAAVTAPGQVTSSETGTQASDEPLWLGQLRQWLDVVWTHQPGTADAGARSIAAWAGELDAIAAHMLALRDLMVRAGARPHVRHAGRVFAVSDIQRLLRLTDDEAHRGDLTRLVTRGAVLHTDIAVLLPHESAPRPSSSAPTGGRGRPAQQVLLLEDGRYRDVSVADAHWGFARALLDLVPPDSPRDRAVRLWYVATGVYLVGRFQFAYADQHLTRARQLFPADPDVLFQHGCLRESYGSARIQSVRHTVARWIDFDLEPPDVQWRQAQGWFRKALDLRPELVEARVRLGRVTGLLGRHEEAARELLRAASDAGDRPVLQYFVALFVGDEEQALGRRDRARASYERAAALYPRAQSPRLALSRLARRYGDRSAAVGSIQRLLAQPLDEADRDDPWWRYHYMPLHDTEGLLEAARQALVAGDPP
jgi:tetratricopeptide (TPR) repeat protein